MNRLIFNSYVLAVLVSGMLLGLFGALGVCVPYWGSQVFDTAFASPPDRSHPAFWISTALLGPAMFIGMTGAFVLLVLPVAFRFPAAARPAPRHGFYLRVLRWWAERMLRFVAIHDEGPDDKAREV